MVNYHEQQRAEASKAICFHYMKVCGIKRLDLPEDELDLIERLSAQKHRK